ncbi:MAG TPA: trypsin-like peptidase domain-containing protein [Candidatus Binatia bacterium]|jgi:S1-C subfamily serine protease
MQRIVAMLILLCFCFLSAERLHAQDTIRDLVVKIHATHHGPDLFRPWTKMTPQKVKGSGVVIDGKRILTNAHVVKYASQIYVQPNQSASHFSAQVEAITPGMDLAVLKLDDESFFDTRGSLPLASELPRVKDAINVYGYPTGGTELSVTQGIVSRIEYTDYYYQAAGLRIQVDAALNFGNSGGPAVSDGKLVGLVFSLIQNAQNIGYLIPVEEIRLFLDDVADGVYDGKPQVFDLIQTVENDALRRRLGLPKGVNGVMIAQPYRNGLDYPLQEWDVITKIGDMPIDSDGKVAIRFDLRLSASYLVQKYATNGLLPLTIFRDGRFSEIQLPVQTRKDLVIPYLMDRTPRYFIYGPFVFSQTTQDYLERLGNQRLPSIGRRPSPLVTRRYDKPTFESEELVIVAAPMFPHRITRGYDDPNRAVLSEINGVPVKNLRHLVELLRDSRDEQITFKFASLGVLTHETMVFNRTDLMEATVKILEENGIRNPYSADLRAVWETPAQNGHKSAAATCCGAATTAN